MHRARQCRPCPTQIVGRWHWRFRSNFSICNVDLLQDATKPSHLCANFTVVPQSNFWEDDFGTTHDARRGRGTRRPPHACLVRIGSTQSLRRSRMRASGFIWVRLRFVTEQAFFLLMPAHHSRRPTVEPTSRSLAGFSFATRSTRSHHFGHTSRHLAFEPNCVRRPHRILLNRVQAMTDLQCAWFILSFCCVTRANCYLRTI